MHKIFLETLAIISVLASQGLAQETPLPRVLVLPLLADSACTADLTNAIAPTSLIEAVQATGKMDAPKDLEWEVVANRNNLFTNPAATQILQASLESQASYTFMPRWIRKDSLCVIQVTALRASDLRTILEWQGEPTKEIPQVPYFNDFLSKCIQQTITANLGKIQIESDPSGASITGLLSPVVVSPFFLDTLPIKEYPITVSAPGYDTLLDTLRPKPGTLLAKRYELKHNKQWIDSVAQAQKKAHRDSILAQAEEGKVQELPAMFSRLLSVTLPTNGTPIAVLPFQVQNASQNLQKLGYDPGVMAAEYGVAYLRKDSRVRVVERTQLDLVLQEQDLAQSDLLMNDSSSVKAGRIAAVRFIVTGTISVAEDRQIFFAKLVDVETGEIISAAHATVSNQKNEDLYRTALGERASPWGAGFRSMVLPGWGQFYTDHQIQGGLFLGAFVVSAGYVAFRFLDYQKYQDKLDKFKDLDPSTMAPGESTESWTARANQAVVDRNKSADHLNASFAILGAVWAANVIDGFVLGILDSRAIRGQYFSAAPIVIDSKISGLAMNISF